MPVAVNIFCNSTLSHTTFQTRNPLVNMTTLFFYQKLLILQVDLMAFLFRLGMPRKTMAQTYYTRLEKRNIKDWACPFLSMIRWPFFRPRVTLKIL